MLPEIVIIGAGNVATHLAHAFQNAGCHIAQVYSRSLGHASRLAFELKDSRPIDDLSLLTEEADLYIISVADAAVATIAEAMPKVKGIVAHTSGSVPLAALTPASDRTAVLYPLQTFTRDAVVDIANVPFFTEASDAKTLEDIDSFARLLSDKVYHADSYKRKTLHIAGVLSCNFVNYLWDCTAQVLAADGYDFSVVEPLVRATLDKAVAIGPRAAQTGPAMRCDAEVMRQHMERLDPDKARIYRELSNEIMKTHKLDCKL
ncbi:MAG: DUF2520 domain-containing protein [Muribaculaceae bacterium]|nr:DUF2520 domain-containing protein [Muribaculaceae bacterium]